MTKDEVKALKIYALFLLFMALGKDKEVIELAYKDGRKEIKKCNLSEEDMNYTLSALRKLKNKYIKELENE